MRLKSIYKDDLKYIISCIWWLYMPMIINPHRKQDISLIIEFSPSSLPVNLFHCKQLFRFVSSGWFCLFLKFLKNKILQNTSISVQLFDQHFCDLSMLLHILAVHSFYCQSVFHNTVQTVHPFPLVMKIGIVFSLGLLWIKMLQAVL